MLAKKSLVGIVVAAVLVLASDRLVPSGAAATTSQDVASDGKSFPARPVAEKPTSVGWKVVVSRDVKSENEVPLLTLVAILSRLEFQPDERAGHFRELETPEYRINSWLGSMESASLTPDGVEVALRVTPRVASKIGASVTILGGVIERYEVTDEGVRYLGSEVPKGGSFQGVITD